jgi:putative flavoprotein involved in K+ transport
LTTNTVPEQATRWLDAFASTLARGDHAATAALFHDESYWRDMLAFSWNIATFEGPTAIRAMLESCAAATAAREWRIDGVPTTAGDTIEAWLTFETAAAHGRGHLRLRNGRCFTLLTVMTDLAGFEEPRGATRPLGAEHRAARSRRSWLELRRDEEATLGVTEQPYCVIVGGGQGGIALGARLRQLGVPAIIVERNARPGDSWRNRYDSLCLHDTVWYDHLPYIPFPEHWPVYTPKDQLADWLEMYTKVMQLAYWGGTTCRRASYDNTTGTWTIELERDGRELVLRPRQLVLATGMSGLPQIPEIPGAERFTGERCHSSAFRSAAPYRGKRCVVLGSNNSAHDIAEALWSQDADVTMIQRSGTTVVRAATLAAGRSIYSVAAAAAGITTELADLISVSTPYAIMHRGGIEATKRLRAADADFYTALERAGFLLDFGEDESGLGMKYHRRGSGYYIDTGASELVIRGEIKLRSGVSIARFTEHSVILTDGSELPADLVVYATGYGPMDGWAAQLISPQVAERVGRVWGIGSGTRLDPGPWEGELRNMWKPTAQPGLWFHGGNLAQSRFFSKLLALQLKARMEGLATPVYGAPLAQHAGAL